MSKFVSIVRQSAFVAAAAAAVVAVSAPAVAAPSRDLPTVKVDIADLDFTSTADQARLQARITKAARLACRYQPSNREMIVNNAQRRCMRQAIGGADVALAARGYHASDRHRVTAFAAPTVPAAVRN